MRALRGVDLDRGEDLLHWTVMPLGPGYEIHAPIIAAVLKEIDLDPFPICWDRLIAVGDHVLLKPSRTPWEVAKLRRAIRTVLGQAGVPIPKQSSPPHVTLNYQWTGEAFKENIEPIVWDVRDIVLIESLTGRARHEPHGTFPLIPRQGFLFPWLKR